MIAVFVVVVAVVAVAAVAVVAVVVVVVEGAVSAATGSSRSWPLSVALAEEIEQNQRGDMLTRV